MPRRRLRLQYSSSEEEQERPQTPITSTTIPNPNPNEAASEATPHEITDDDFVDVPENFSTPSPPPAPPPPAPASDQSFSGVSSDSSVNEFLRRLGLNLRREWLDSCISGLTSVVAGFSSFGVEEKARLCFEQFLFSDMNCSGDGVLPENVHSLHLVDLGGPFVLQVDEIVNISCPLRDRYQNAAAGIKRCLKLSMTDGVQRVFGMEYRPIKDLEVLAPAGSKVAIRNVNIRRGLLMLVPEVIRVLGGLVEDLDAAHLRLVHEVNKPPRGKRTRTGVVPSLASRATLAAWPTNDLENQGHASNPTVQGTTPVVSSNNVGFSANGSREQVTEEFSVPWVRPNAESNPLSDAFDVDGNDRIDTTTASRGVERRELTTEELVDPRTIQNSRLNPASTTICNSSSRETDAVDKVEDPLLLTGDNEIPFTYLASLLAKWAMNQNNDVRCIQGKIKCFLTGVKGFQFKNRTKFELHVYVDDGSLISEVLIDHNVVQKAIGYSPQEVTAALSSSDKTIVSEMKDLMMQFQVFLADFEGTIVVEMNRSSALPVALEMNEGCLASDAWLLLRRVKQFTSPQTPQHRHQAQLIDISP